MTNIIEGTVTVSTGSPNFTWVGAALTSATVPGDSQITVKGITYYVLSITDTTHGVFTRNFTETGGSGFVCEINPMTADQTSTASLNANTQTLMAQFTAFDAYGRGLKMKYVNDTGLADPGPGGIAFNNGTLASATGTAIDNLDASVSNLDITGVVDSWDDSTSLPHGTLWVRSIATLAYVAFAINGPIVNSTGFRTCTSLVYIGGAGTLAIGEAVMVWSERNGNQAFTSSDSSDNMSLAASVASSALTLRVKQPDGTTDPTATSPVNIGVRSATATSGVYNLRQVTAALSLTVPSGATLGATSGVADNLYLYVQDNAGTLELVISGTDFGDSSIQTTTTISAGATSAAVAYAATGRAGVAMRKIGVMTSTQTTAGTWAAVPTVLRVGPFGEAETEFFKSLKSNADAPSNRTSLGLGTAAVQNTGTSGANVPLLNGGNTWSAAQSFSAAILQRQGTINTQSQVRNIGWGTGAERWGEFIEADASYSLYAYNSSGTFIGQMINIGQGGIITLPYGQLAFPASQNASSDANTLDDYEEGSSAATVTASSGSFSSVSFTWQYTKIGRAVVMNGEGSVGASGIGTAAGTLIATIPFITISNGALGLGYIRSTGAGTFWVNGISGGVINARTIAASAFPLANSNVWDMSLSYNTST